MAIFHFLTVTPVTNHPQAKEHLQLGNFMLVANDRAAAWNLIKDRPEIAPASEVWAALIDEGQQLLVTPHFKGRENEDWRAFVEWTRVQERYYLVRRSGLALNEWGVARP